MTLTAYAEHQDSEVEWIGYIPAHWFCFRMKLSVDLLRNGLWGEDAKGDESDIVCVRVADFDRRTLRVRLESPTIRSVETQDRESRTLSRLDLLIEKSGGGENQPVGAVVLYDHDQPAICSNFVARIALKEKMDPSFWCYVHAAAYSARINTRSIKQTSGIQNLDSDQYFDERAPFPPLSEQKAIALFLNRETTKIDSVIAEQEGLIRLLNEKQQAIILHAVTKGLDPNAPMKDSGVTWLGEVPEKWTVARVKSCALLITSGPRGWSERISDDGVLFIQSGDLDDDLHVQTNRAKRVNVRPDAEALRSRLQDGDVVVCITGAKTGNVGIFNGGGAEAYINQHLSLVRPNHRISPRFLGYVLKGSPGQLHFYTSQYGLKQGLSLEDVASAPVALPPLSEQDQIVALVDEQIARLDVLETEATRAITLLRERRAALISAAVTGKIDVRSSVADTSSTQAAAE